MSWILSYVSSWVSGVDDDEAEKKSLERELTQETLKKEIVDSVCISENSFETMQPDDSQSQNIVFMVVEHDEWYSTNSEFRGMQSGKTRVFTGMTSIDYLRLAFMENIQHGKVELSSRYPEGSFVYGGAISPHQREIQSTNMESRAIVDSRFHIVALVLPVDVASRLQSSLNECSDDEQSHLYSNQDYTLEYKYPRRIRLHLNQPIKKLQDCWFQLRQPEIPVREPTLTLHLNTTSRENVVLELRENAAKLGWDRKRIETIKFK